VTTALPTTPAPPTASTVPPADDRRVYDLTWVSDDEGWMLEGLACPAGTCGALFHTTDGGATWARAGTQSLAVAPNDAHVCQQQGCVSHVRFASATLGYLWGPDLLMTSDGGGTWRRQPTPQVLSLEVAGPSVIRLVTPQGYPGPAEIDRAPLGSTVWTALPVSNPGVFGGSVVPSGATLYVAFFGHTAGGAADAHTSFARSGDGGSTWTAFGDPCGGTGSAELDAWSPAAAPGGVLAVLCVPRVAAGGAPSVSVSTDAGSHFGPLRILPAIAGTPDRGTTMLAAMSANSLAVALPGGPDRARAALWSGDGGRTWRQTLSAPPASTLLYGYGPQGWLGFEDTLVGRLSFPPHGLWTTHDSGQTWRESPVP
jgi:hypothetical protein